MQTREAHYVTFYSPGTLMSERTTKSIHAWDLELAVAMAKTITKRYDARPYGFYFSTMLEAVDVVETDRGSLMVQPRQIAKSGMHYLGGTVMTIQDVEARDDPNDSILISNMRINSWEHVVEVTNGYRSTHLFSPGDVIVGENGLVTERCPIDRTPGILTPR